MFPSWFSVIFVKENFVFYFSIGLHVLRIKNKKCNIWADERLSTSSFFPALILSLETVQVQKQTWIHNLLSARIRKFLTAQIFFVLNFNHSKLLNKPLVALKGSTAYLFLKCSWAWLGSTFALEHFRRILVIRFYNKRKKKEKVNSWSFFMICSSRLRYSMLHTLGKLPR